LERAGSQILRLMRFFRRPNAHAYGEGIAIVDAILDHAMHSHAYTI